MQLCPVNLLSLLYDMEPAQIFRRLVTPSLYSRQSSALIIESVKKKI